MSALFDELRRRSGTNVDRRGQVHLDCPDCGKEVKRGQHHFSFSEQGGHCFVCGYSCSLERLARDMDVSADVVRAHKPMMTEKPMPLPRSWQKDPESYLQRYTAAWGRVEGWTAYKPLTLDTIARWRLGVGALPSSPCSHRRLIYPVIEKGVIVGFRGRAERCDCDKWISAGGTTARLWGIDNLRPGASVIIAENPVDAMLAMQEDPSIIAVAGTAGAGTWRDEWTAAIAASRPAVVLVWYDNDLAGGPNSETYKAELKIWLQTMQSRLRAGKIARIPDAPKPKSPEIVRSLRAAGVAASAYEWPAGTAPHADLGGLLADEILRRAA